MYVQRLRRRGAAGFTLVELLAVIAIIGILAAIVVPNVARYIGKAREARAVSEVTNAETALVGMLSDTKRSRFRDFLTKDARDELNAIASEIEDATPAASLAALQRAERFYGEFFYELLRQGRDADMSLAAQALGVGADKVLLPEVRQKLGTSYMDIGVDPWDNRYNFWMGPLRGANPIRSYRSLLSESACPNDDAFIADFELYVYGPCRANEERKKLPGQPPADKDTIRTTFDNFPFSVDFDAYGYPAPNDLPVYIWSNGPNLENDANLLRQFAEEREKDFPEFLGGGDDPNNWDSEAGWENAPDA